MANEWILDVLADLKSFAIKNDLPELADGLGEVSRIAAEEMAIRERSMPPLIDCDAERAGRLYRADGSRGNARGSH